MVFCVHGIMYYDRFTQTSYINNQMISNVILHAIIWLNENNLVETRPARWSTKVAGSQAKLFAKIKNFIVGNR